ncbi:MAG: MFS transporter [Pseudomonadota bacterium]
MTIFHDLWLTRRPLAGFLLIGIAWAAFFAQMPEIKARIGASDAAYGTILLVASGGALLALWLAPLAEQRLGRLGAPVAGLCVGLGMLITGFSTDVYVFGLAMGLASMGAGVVDVLINVRVSEVETRTGRSLMSLNHALYSFAYAGAALGVGLLRELNWSPSMVFLLVMGLFIGPLAIGMTPRRSVEVPEPVTTSAAPVLGAAVWLSGLIVMLAFLTESVSEGWSALHLERTLGGGPAEGALGPAIIGLAMGMGRLVGHLLGRRWREMHVMGAGCLLAVFGLILVAGAGDLRMAYVGFALTGFGVSVVAPLSLAVLGRSVPSHARLHAISRASVMGYGAFFIGPPLMGLTAEVFGLRAGFSAVAALMLFAACVVLPALSCAFVQVDA